MAAPLALAAIGQNGVMSRRTLLLLPAVLLVSYGFQAARKPAVPIDPIIAGFQKTTVASVADAVDQVCNRRGFLSHDVRPFVAGKVVGRARTSLVKPSAPEQSTPALAVKSSVDMIDSAKQGEVGVIVVEGSLDVSGIGGLMATAAKSRGMAGMVLDGSVRDIGEIRAMGLPIYARGASPATAVSRFASVARDIEVTCAGVNIKPGDIIVAGEDGVVAVPQDQAAAVLKRAQEIDERETQMVPFIKQFRSLTKAIEKFNRI